MKEKEGGRQWGENDNFNMAADKKTSECNLHELLNLYLNLPFPSLPTPFLSHPHHYYRIANPTMCYFIGEVWDKKAGCWTYQQSEHNIHVILFVMFLGYLSLQPGLNVCFLVYVQVKRRYFSSSQVMKMDSLCLILLRLQCIQACTPGKHEQWTYSLPSNVCGL